MSRQKYVTLAIGLIACFTGSRLSRAAVIYVKADATGANNGSNWANAYTSLQTALSAATSVDEIWVAAVAGQPYKPGTGRTDTFSLKNGAEIYGGFDGTELLRDDRDVAGNETILSGDIGTIGVATDNSYHVVTANAVDPDTRLDGFTIRDGVARNSIFSDFQGAGIFITGGGSSPRIAQCTIEDNDATASISGHGGGANVNTNLGNPRFENCIFRNNQARIWGGGLYGNQAQLLTVTNCDFQNNATTDNATDVPGGGALYVGPDAVEARFTDCQFVGNASAATSLAGGGGAVLSRSVVTLRGCTFDNNAATFATGGGMHAASTATTTIVDCTFTNNESANNGGGVVLSGGDFDIVNGAFLNNRAALNGGGVHFAKPENEATITNCLFAGNTATTGNGGAMEGVASSGGDPPVTATNLTIVNNHAGVRFGGISIQRQDGIILANCILWGNTDNDNVDAQLGTTDPNAPDPPEIAVTYSDIEDGFAGTGNISADPLFVDELNGDFRLQPCSPGIDASDYGAVVLAADPGDLDLDSNLTEPTPFDLDGLPRAFDSPHRDPNGGVGTFDFTDMGAYENNVPQCTLPGDLLVDSAVDGLDIAPFIACVLDESSDCPCADLDLSGLADIGDVGCFVNLLLTGVGCEVSCSGGLRGFPDCNANGIPDASDVSGGASEDCNVNGIPDECDVDPGDPDGNLLVSADVNTNAIPDECEADCNGNGTPDDYDVSTQTSADVNTNGVPDECETDCNANGTPDDWDIAQSTSADCNTNGAPDECEQDCNSNGVPDDCDVDPTDPDGNTFVSPDCNANEFPDECDLTLPPGFGSLDCNTNGTPDECDIAACESGPACDDCNANGIPDGCDIAAAISEDADSNGIPDECEGQQAQGGGSGGGEAMASTSAPADESFFDEQAAWTEFWDWSCDLTQGDNPSLTGDERFAAMVAKLQELGLPVMNPAMALSAR